MAIWRTSIAAISRFGGGRKKTSLAAVLLALVIGVALTSRFVGPTAPKAADSPTGAGDGTPVTAAEVVIADFGVTLEALGTVTPIATVSVTSEVSGKLVKIFYEEGQMVKAGDVLAEIDQRPFENALHQAEGQLARDQAQLENAKLDLERYRALVTLKSESGQRRDTQKSLVHQLEGAVKIDQAQVDDARLKLDYSRIKAPVSGRVGLRLVDLGNYVSAGGTSGIAVITQLQPITVVFPVAEDYLPGVTKQLRLGKALSASAYDRAGATLLAQGALLTIDNQVDPATGTVKFKAQFENRDQTLFPNQFVNVRLAAETLKGMAIIPAAAIQYGPKGAFVFEVLGDDTVAMKPVTLRKIEEEKAAVSAGLAAGARVVVAGADRLREGAKVKAASVK